LCVADSVRVALRRVLVCLFSSTCSRLAQLAMALAQLKASNLDSLALESNDMAASSSSSSSGSSDAPDVAAGITPAGSGSGGPEQREQQRAAAEAARALLVKLCDAVRGQHAMDLAAVATFVHAMARLAFYDWPTMRHVCSLLQAQPQVSTTRSRPSLWCDFALTAAAAAAAAATCTAHASVPCTPPPPPSTLHCSCLRRRSSTPPPLPSCW
jgi:hypothetical protein